MKESNIVLYETEDGLTKIDVKLEDENIWLNQEQLVLLFQSSKSNVSEHIKNIFNEGELIESS
ncbi:MAG: cell filamentation protein Fic, partial [Mollicutes bacterium]|nr:cell filamentation protein Fic [Mollicutes bacterium]